MSRSSFKTTSQPRHLNTAEIEACSISWGSPPDIDFLQTSTQLGIGGAVLVVRKTGSDWFHQSRICCFSLLFFPAFVGLPLAPSKVLKVALTLLSPSSRGCSMFSLSPTLAPDWFLLSSPGQTAALGRGVPPARPHLLFLLLLCGSCVPPGPKGPRGAPGGPQIQGGDHHHHHHRRHLLLGPLSLPLPLPRHLQGGGAGAQQRAGQGQEEEEAQEEVQVKVEDQTRPPQRLQENQEVQVGSRTQNTHFNSNSLVVLHLNSTFSLIIDWQLMISIMAKKHYPHNLNGSIQMPTRNGESRTTLNFLPVLWKWIPNQFSSSVHQPFTGHFTSPVNK